MTIEHNLDIIKEADWIIDLGPEGGAGGGEVVAMGPPTEILAAPRSRGDHLLVYQTAEGHEELARILADTGYECRIYGMRRGIAEEQVEGNLRYRPFSEESFIADLASARAVLSGGGFSLMGEAVYLGKPMLSVPLEKQFEQQLNALYLGRLGYGEYHLAADEEAIRGFLARSDQYAQNLKAHHQDGNREILAAVDRLLDEIAAERKKSRSASGRG